MRRLAQILAEEGLTKEAIDWDAFAEAPQQSTWQNYNTIGTRKYIRTVLDLLGTNEPASTRILYKKEAPEEFSRLMKKWWRKGRNVKERGIAGRLVTKGGKGLLLGVVGGDEVLIQGPGFKL